MAGLLYPAPVNNTAADTLQFETVLLRKEDMCARVPSVITPSCMPADLCRRWNPRKKSPRLNPSWLKWPGFEKGSEDTPGFLAVFFIAPDSTEMDINFRFCLLLKTRSLLLINRESPKVLCLAAAPACT